MAGGLAIIGIVALLACAAEVLARLTAPKRRYQSTDVDCLWPRVEPEVERLRRKGAL